MCYRETKNPKYLALAQNIANFILNHKNMPQDLVFYYDFDAPNIPNEPRDASAAAVIASALFELKAYTKTPNHYLEKANLILDNLSKNYTSAIDTNKGFILDHSTGSKPQNSEVDVPISYADYYYLEAIARSKRLKNKEVVVE